MTAIQTIDLTCPNCEQQFTSPTIDGPRPRGRKRTDFQLDTDTADTLALAVHLCDRCGFAGKKELFSPANPVSYEVRQHIWDELAPRIAELTPSASERFEFAAKVASWDGAPGIEVADLWLRAAWCCVDEGDSEAERYYRRHAAWQFEETLDTYDAVDGDSRPVLTYLVGELWRRIGDTAQANEWFDQVADEVLDQRKHAWILKLAKQQRNDPQEWSG